MRVLVLASVYPALNGPVTPMYIHMRNKYYKRYGFEVTVLNFAAKEDYILDSIEVITKKTFHRIRKNRSFDLLVSHAPNLRNHYRFIVSHKHLFRTVVFVFHGHEVLRASKVYPKPFLWKTKSSRFRIALQDLYDTVKLKVWRNYFARNISRSYLVFVSRWMYQQFISNTGIDSECLKGRFSVIYNSVGEIFEECCYYPDNNTQYDFVTIRRNIDGEKYSIDFVNELAKNNPGFRFLVIGRGKLFEHIDKAKNLTWIDKNLNHDDMISVLNSARCALMPTRTDAQGLLACEMATYGIPVITSDIPICHEVFDDFCNVRFLSNQDTAFDLGPLLEELASGVPYRKNLRYCAEQTSGEEVRLFEDILSRLTH